MNMSNVKMINCQTFQLNQSYVFSSVVHKSAMVGQNKGPIGLRVRLEGITDRLVGQCPMAGPRIIRDES